MPRLALVGQGRRKEHQNVRYLSVCSGIEAASVAWQPLGWKAVGFSEIDAFPSAVLAHHYPSVVNYGDMAAFQAWDVPDFDVLVGGTPCQSFSISGLRGGLNDPRGNLALVYCRILERFKPKWFVWENVPGVLSSNKGGDFGSFLGAVAELGYGFAYRVLDAQNFGVPQRRRRVFVVGCFGDWRRATEVLFEPESLRGSIAPSRKKGEGTSAATQISIGENGGAHALTATSRSSEDRTGRGIPLVAPTIDASYGRLQGQSGQDLNHGHGHLIPMAFGWQNSASQGDCVSTEHSPTLDRSKTPAIAFDLAQITSATNRTRAEIGTPTSTLAKGSNMPVAVSAAVRRLTPRECERLQGFPDDFTRVPYRKSRAADGPRYKALGNSMAVPVVKWIGERIQAQIENCDSQIIS